MDVRAVIIFRTTRFGAQKPLGGKDLAFCPDLAFAPRVFSGHVVRKNKLLWGKGLCAPKAIWDALVRIRPSPCEGNAHPRGAPHPLKGVGPVVRFHEAHQRRF